MCLPTQYAWLEILRRTVWPGDLWQTSRIGVLQAYSLRKVPMPETQRTFCVPEEIDADPAPRTFCVSPCRTRVALALAEAVSRVKLAAATRIASPRAANRPRGWRSLPGCVGTVMIHPCCAAVYIAPL